MTLISDSDHQLIVWPLSSYSTFSIKYFLFLHWQNKEGDLHDFSGSRWPLCSCILKETSVAVTLKRMALGCSRFALLYEVNVLLHISDSISF